MLARRLGALVVAASVCGGLVGCGAASSSSSTATSTAFTQLTSTSAPPSPAVLHKAAALLHAADVHYQNVFDRGVVVVLNRGQPNSFPAFSAWFQSVNGGQLPPSNNGTQAMDLLPNSYALTDWQNHELNGDIGQLANDGADVGGPSDAAARQRVHADIKRFQADLATEERDVSRVAAGK